MHHANGVVWEAVSTEDRSIGRSGATRAAAIRRATIAPRDEGARANARTRDRGGSRGRAGALTRLLELEGHRRAAALRDGLLRGGFHLQAEAVVRAIRADDGGDARDGRARGGLEARVGALEGALNEDREEGTTGEGVSASSRRARDRACSGERDASAGSIRSERASGSTTTDDDEVPARARDARRERRDRTRAGARAPSPGRR